MDLVKPLTVAVTTAAIGCGGMSACAQVVAQFDRETTARLQALQPFIDEASARFGISDDWIRAVIAAESGARTTANGEPITSRAGAIGPMQVMPKTYDELRLRYGLGPDPADPKQNILAGTAYLKELYQRFGRSGMFAAYNAGPARYQAYLNGNLPLPAETGSYLAALGIGLSRISAEAVFRSGSGLFFPLSGRDPVSAAAYPPSNPDALFMPLRSRQPSFPSKTIRP